ncbi:MAG: STAS-like domain-containing protein [Solirubrobacteraceae bacterium]
MSFRCRLSEFGSTFATRPRGLELREDLIRRADQEASVTIDLENVLSVSYSFADEFVAGLVQESANGNVPFEVEIVGASPEVERVVRRAIDLRQSLPTDIGKTAA